MEQLNINFNQDKQTKIYFISPYNNPKIHISYDGETGKNWSTVEMKKSSKQRDLYVYKLEHFQKIIFVFCSQDKKNWVNPNTEFCKKKYYIKNCEKKKYLENGSYNFFLNQKLHKKQKYIVFDSQIISLSQRKHNKKLVIVSDLDDTLICHHNHQPYQTFKKFYLKHFLMVNCVKLIYNTGRSREDWHQLQSDHNLLYPDFLILESGTRIYDCKIYKNQELKQGIQEHLDYQQIITQNWDQHLVKDVMEKVCEGIQQYQLRQTTNSCTRVTYVPPTKLLQTYREKIDLLLDEFRFNHAINAKYIISGEGDYQYIDIVSENADKGNATIYCVENILGMKMEDTVSFGDSRNDCQMLEITNKSFIVRNAKESLRKWYEDNKKSLKHVQISVMEYSYALLLRQMAEPIKSPIPILQIYPPQQQMPAILHNIDKWCFPQGIMLIKEGDSKFQRIENYINSEDEKLVMSVSDINYFVLTDLKTSEKYYCSAANVYEKVYLPDKQAINEKSFIRIYVPKCICLISKIPIFIPQKQVLCLLVQVHKMKQNSERDKIVEVYKDEKVYAIEESKLQDYYISTLFKYAKFKNENCTLEFIFGHNISKQHSSMSESNTRTVNNSGRMQTPNLYSTKNYPLFSMNIKNNEYIPLQNIIHPSNNAFDAVIFNQCPFNLYKLLLYMLQEYQIIILTRRSAYATIFAQNMVELLKPLTWRGAFIPFLIRNNFDYEYTSIPYIVGIDKSKFVIPQEFRSDIKRRVIYDLDEGRFILSTVILYFTNFFEKNIPIKYKKGNPEVPKLYQNFLIKKINNEISELKFWEEDYFEEGILRYRQAFYNFILLIFHDLLHYFSSTMNVSVDEKENQQQQSQSQHSNSNSLNTAEIKKKKIAYFNFKAYLNSFKEVDRPFFEIMTRTQMFSQFIKECFKAIDFKEEFIHTMKKRQLDFTFPSVFQFIKDVRVLAQRKGCFSDDLDQKFSTIESKQNDVIQQVLNNESFPSQSINIYQELPEYMESLQKQESTDFGSTQGVVDPEGLSQYMSNKEIQKNLESESIISSPGSQNRRKIKQQIHHLKLFDKKFTLAKRLQSDDIELIYTPQNQKNQQGDHPSFNQINGIIADSNYRDKSDKASTIFEIHSAYSNNFGKYLPLKRSSTKSHSKANEINMSFTKATHNKSYNSLWANFGEISESNNENQVGSGLENTLDKQAEGTGNDIGTNNSIRLKKETDILKSSNYQNIEINNNNLKKDTNRANKY